MTGKLFDPARNEGGVRIYLTSFGSTASWYTTQAQEIDAYSKAQKEFLIIVSAGNEGTSSKSNLFFF
jgi:hypothetical protein